MPQKTVDLHSQIYASPILIVDDNEINRIFISKTLQARGFTKLLCVASAEEALEQIDKFRPSLLILDVRMPGMDGFECCAAIRSQPRYQDLPILIQTTITEPELRVKAFQQGATDFISKPIYPDELCARVTVHLEKLHSLKTLQKYKQRVELELESARDLQQAILPSIHELEDVKRRSGIDIASYFEPSSEIGGDFWGMKTLFPHQTALWIVDFSGHGVASALNAFRLQAYLMEYTTTNARPGEYLSQMNDKMLHLLLRGQFATMFYGIVDTQSNRLFYACACAPHPIILRKSSGKAEMIDGSGNPLGLGMHLYPTQSIPFFPGDTLLLYSDALTETPNAQGEYISEENIMALMENHKDYPPNVIKKELLAYFKAHAGRASYDDLTFVLYAKTKS